MEMMKKKYEVCIDISASYGHHFLVSGSIIKRLNTYNNGNLCQLVIRDVIPKDKVYSFKIKLVYFQGTNIMVGITDIKQGKNNVSSF
jgi:hypothetical protein